jgi:hypothetical protein
MPGIVVITGHPGPGLIEEDSMARSGMFRALAPARRRASADTSDSSRPRRRRKKKSRRRARRRSSSS